jgi:hypothetical protein
MIIVINDDDTGFDERMDGCTEGCIDEWMGGCLDELMDGWTDS